MYILTVETEDKKKLDRIVEFIKSLKGCNFSIEEVTENEEIDVSPIVSEPLTINKFTSHVEVVAAQVVPRHLRDDTPFEIYAFVRGKEVYVGKTSIGAENRMQEHINAAKKTQDEFLLWIVEGMKDGSLERGIVATCVGLSEAGKLERGYIKSAEKAGIRVLNKTHKLKEIETIWWPTLTRFCWRIRATSITQLVPGQQNESDGFVRVVVPRSRPQCERH